MDISTLKQFLKKNKLVDSLSRIACYPFFEAQSLYSDYCANLRKKGKSYLQYEWILDLKDKYKGERCFVVATGPSLTMEDLNALQNEYCFGMNSCILAFDKTDWRPDFFVIQDEYVYQKLETELTSISENELQTVWVSQLINSKFNIPSHFNVFALHYLDHKMFHKRGYGSFRFSDNCYACIYDGYSVTFSILQMACYMGFSEVYLLGCDCNYNQSKSHFIDYGHHDPKAAIMGDKMIAGHFAFKEYADSIGVKVVNCTRGGMLEVYPRMLLEDVLKEK